MKSHQARCSCGQLRVTTKGEPIRVSVFHCYACQHRTGSIFGVQARFNESNVDIAGRNKQYLNDGGNKWKIHIRINL
jgi:hypothetical protein